MSTGELSAVVVWSIGVTALMAFILAVGGPEPTIARHSETCLTVPVSPDTDSSGVECRAFNGYLYCEIPGKGGGMSVDLRTFDHDYNMDGYLDKMARDRRARSKGEK